VDVAVNLVLVLVFVLLGGFVGEIRDEYDPSAHLARPAPGGSFDVDGLLHCGDFEAQTGIALPDEPYDTLGGFVMQHLGRIRVLGDTVEAADHRFSVTALDGRRVARVQVAPTTPPDVPETGTGRRT
jgi:putative hemolysin